MYWQSTHTQLLYVAHLQPIWIFHLNQDVRVLWIFTWNIWYLSYKNDTLSFLLRVLTEKLNKSCIVWAIITWSHHLCAICSIHQCQVYMIVFKIVYYRDFGAKRFSKTNQHNSGSRSANYTRTILFPPRVSMNCDNLNRSDCTSGQGVRALFKPRVYYVLYHSNRYVVGFCKYE